MAKQLMIYDNIQPLSSQAHRDFAVSVESYAFASHLISVPVVATEIPLAANEFPIVFSATGKEGEYLPLAIMGIREGENLYIDSGGRFSTNYVPAFIRRYPFILGGDKGSDSMALCIDLDSSAVVKDGSKGVRLFTEAGEQSDYLKNILEFLKDYHLRAEMTKTFCGLLHKLELLEPMQANITLKGAEQQNVNLTGFYVINREKLKAISDEAALDLFKRDGLELIYSHLQSLGGFNRLIKRASDKLKESQPA